MWWLSGIFRDVTLLSVPPLAVWDVAVDPGLHENGRFATLTVRATVQTGGTAGTPRLEMKLLDADKKAVDGAATISGIKTDADMAEVMLTVDVDAPRLWSAEDPYLYTLLLTLRDEASEVVAVVPQKVGFRRVEVQGARLLVNGTAVKLRGVNRHEHHPDFGRALPYSTMLEDVLLMKQHNINTVRTSHYPPHPHFLDLCDAYGLYVIDEADLECHGLWRIERHFSLSSDPDWRNAYVDRMERMVERDKNHACVILWSLGNESGFVTNHEAVAAWVRDRYPHFLIHYEARWTGQPGWGAVQAKAMPTQNRRHVLACGRPLWTKCLRRMCVPRKTAAISTHVGWRCKMGAVWGCGRLLNQRHRSATAEPAPSFSDC
jgi:beta-galactosidase/evolved beta-galactosidase subunit alpha